MRPIRSYDSRKKAIVKVMKERFSVTRITDLRESKTHFEATVMRYDHTLERFVNLGKASIEKGQVQ